MQIFERSKFEEFCKYASVKVVFVLVSKNKCFWRKLLNVEEKKNLYCWSSKISHPLRGFGGGTLNGNFRIFSFLAQEFLICEHASPCRMSCLTRDYFAKWFFSLIYAKRRFLKCFKQEHLFKWKSHKTLWFYSV